MTPPNGLLQRCQTLLEKREAQSGRRRLSIAPPGSIDFSSNDFLSLSKSKALRSAYLEELSTAIEAPLGSGGSRLLDGNSHYAEEIERDVANFLIAESGLLFNSGFDANSGLFSCVPQPGDVIIYDEYIHASVHEGMRLSRAGLQAKFNHNSITDFERILRAIMANDSAIEKGLRNVIVAVETVYSMDGDVAPIKDILDLMDRLLPMKNGHMIVDEAHATGVYGDLGRGVVSELGVENRILARLHTFGKALSSGGAIVLCSSILRDYLINYARSLIYTTALGLPTLAMIKTVHAFMRDGKTEEAQHNLWHLISYLQSRLACLPNTPLIQNSTNRPTSPIFSICTPHPRDLARYCQARNFMVRPIVPPTVPEGTQRVRVCLHAGNTTEEIDALVGVIQQWTRDRGHVRDMPSASPRVFRSRI